MKKLILLALLAWSVPSLHAQMVPGSRSLALDANNKPTQVVSLNSPNWIDVLGDSHLSALIRSGSSASREILVSADTGSDVGPIVGARGTTLPFKSIAAALAVAQPYDHLTVQPGSYTDAGIATVSTANLTIDGYGAKIVCQNTTANPTAEVVKFNVLAPGAKIRGLEIDGNLLAAPTSATSPSGLIQIAAQNCVVQDCNIHDSFATAIHPNADFGNLLVTHNTVNNCTIGVQTGMNGTTDVDGVEVSYNRFVNCPQGGYRGTNDWIVHANTPTNLQIRNEKIVGNTVIILGAFNNSGTALGIELWGAGLHAVVNGATITRPPHYHAIVSGNVVDGYAYGISLNACVDAVAANNIATRYGYCGIEWANSQGGNLSGNYLDSQSGGYGYSVTNNAFDVGYPCNLYLHGDTIINANNQSGIHTLLTSSVLIDAERITGAQCPIYLQDGNSFTVQNCDLTIQSPTGASGATNYGIWFQGVGGTTGTGYHAFNNKIHHPNSNGQDYSIINLVMDQSGGPMTDVQIVGNWTDVSYCGSGFVFPQGVTGTFSPYIADNYPEATGAGDQGGFSNVSASWQVLASDRLFAGLGTPANGQGGVYGWGSVPGAGSGPVISMQQGTTTTPVFQAALNNTFVHQLVHFDSVIVFDNPAAPTQPVYLSVDTNGALHVTHANGTNHIISSP